MTLTETIEKPVIRGIDGAPLSLPPPSRNHRWTARTKANLLLAIDGGLIDVEQASTRYGISLEELELWRADCARYGVDGLKVTKIQTRRGVP